MRTILKRVIYAARALTQSLRNVRRNERAFKKYLKQAETNDKKLVSTVFPKKILADEIDNRSKIPKSIIDREIIVLSVFAFISLL